MEEQNTTETEQLSPERLGELYLLYLAYHAQQQTESVLYYKEEHNINRKVLTPLTVDEFKNYIDAMGPEEREYWIKHWTMGYAKSTGVRGAAIDKAMERSFSGSRSAILKTEEN